MILYTVFVKFLGVGSNIPHYPIYLLLGLVMWTFFSEMTVLSLSSIVGRGDLIRKIRIPRWIIVLSTSITALINLCLNLVIVLIFILINRSGFQISLLLFPLIMLQLYLFALSLSLFLAAAFVKYRDMTHIWEVCMQGLFYLTPVIFPLSLIPNQLVQKIIMINPVATAIQDARYAVVSHSSLTINSVYNSGYARLIPYGITLILLILSVLYFKKEAKNFAENL